MAAGSGPPGTGVRCMYVCINNYRERRVLLIWLYAIILRYTYTVCIYNTSQLY